MNYIVKFLLPFVKTYLLKELAKEENRTFVVAKLNQHVDLPNMTEEEEKVVIDKIYDSITQILKAYMNVPD